MNGGWLLLAAYTCSGAAGLMYEVAWTRLLTLYMGHTIAAASTVTAAFMGGLGLGSALGGRLADRLTVRQAVYAYVTLEVIILVTAIAMPYVLTVLTPALSWTYRDGRSTFLFPLVRLFGCLVVLLVPSVALGATFPMAVRRFVSASTRGGGAGGKLYAANTAGAAFGALSAGLLLIPSIGLTGTTLVGGGASLLSIGIALTLVRRDSREIAGTSPPLGAPSVPSKARVASRGVRRANRQPERSRETNRKRYGLAAAVLSLTGFSTFVYEITWTRVFSVTLGPSTYAFASTLTAFIVGLAAGSFMGALVAERTRRPAFFLAIGLGGTAIVACLASSLTGRALLHYVIESLAVPTQTYADVLLRHVGIIAALIAPIAFGLGFTFPLALELATEGHERLAHRMGAVFAFNTFAAVAGSLTAGFAAIPFLGLQRTILLATAILLLGACLVVFRGMSSLRERFTAMLPVAGACAWLIMSPPWDRELLASGAYMYTRVIPAGLDLETALKAGTLLYYREGATATVSVKRLTGDLSLAIDGKVDASTSGDMLTQKTLAHLPLLLHSAPSDVAIIGLGSGVTLASALVHPVASVDVVEISPEVVEASRYFSAVNHNALDDPRTHLILGDGRSHLSLSSRRYDVIISEPSNPWMAGVAALFTREFFLTARSRLASGGIFCQWAHTYAISEEDLRSVVATFESAFPNGTMWLIGSGDLLLIGSADTQEPRLDNMAIAWQRPGIAADLDDVAAVPFALLSMYVGGPEELRRYADAAPLQTDDRMALEFSGPLALYGGTSHDNASTLRQYMSADRRPPTIARAFAEAGADEWRARATMLTKADAHDLAYQSYVTSLNLSPTDADAVAGFVPAAVRAHQETDATAHLKGWLSAHPQSVALWIGLSKLSASRGSLDEAVDAATSACRIEPPDAAAFEQLASVYADFGDGARLEPIVDTLQRLFPERAGTWHYAASLKFLSGRLPEAFTLAQKATQLDPRRAATHNLLGAIHANLGHAEQARAAFETALRLDPRDSAVYVNLGLLELTAGKNALAAGLFAEALSLDPTSSSARQGLAQANMTRLR